MSFKALEPLKPLVSGLPGAQAANLQTLEAGVCEALSMRPGHVAPSRRRCRKRGSGSCGAAGDCSQSISGGRPVKKRALSEKF